jgi:hypothetical protein
MILMKNSMKNPMKNSTDTEILSGVPAISLLQKQQSTQTSRSSSSCPGIAVLYHCWSPCKPFGSCPKVLGKTAKDEDIDA